MMKVFSSGFLICMLAGCFTIPPEDRLASTALPQKEVKPLKERVINHPKGGLFEMIMNSGPIKNTNSVSQSNILDDNGKLPVDTSSEAIEVDTSDVAGSKIDIKSIIKWFDDHREVNKKK
ncbi:hypothetical protein N9814_01310 [bacterium]|mgnify:FL=1|nr:hypothetical protein [Planktomarina temperata]MDB4227866.1 hypothetical protein [bacterium]